MSVTNATGTFTRSSDTSGTLVISSPTGNVTFSVVGETAETLAGTTWKFSSYLSNFFPTDRSYYITGTATSGSYSLSVDYIEDPGWTGWKSARFASNSSYYPFFTVQWDTDSYKLYWRRFTDWNTYTSISPITIKITGGTDATNATLIAWFKANATQIS